MKSILLINEILADPNFLPGKYENHQWFANKLLEIGFYWEDDSPPHYKLRASSLIVTISPFPNVVIVDKNCGSFHSEIYCQREIPQNESEFDQFWNNLKSKI